jgi:hypothetical protein
MTPKWLRERRRRRLRAMEAMMRPPMIVRAHQLPSPPSTGRNVAMPIATTLEITHPAREAIAELRRHEARRR